MDNAIDVAIFEMVADKCVDVFDVEKEMQRLDSVNIKSNIARLGRIGIFVKCINKFLVNLRRYHRALFDELPEDIMDK